MAGCNVGVDKSASTAKSTTADSPECSVCLEQVVDSGRSTAKLQCGHQFHLDCIGSAFNAKHVMQCPCCRNIEKEGHWRFSTTAPSEADPSSDHMDSPGHLGEIDEDGDYDSSSDYESSPAVTREQAYRNTLEELRMRLRFSIVLFVIFAILAILYSFIAHMLIDQLSQGQHIGFQGSRT